MREIAAPTRDEAIVPAPAESRRPGRRRRRILAFVLVATLGLGWAGGLKKQQILESGDGVSALRQAGARLQSGDERVRRGIASRIEGWASGPGTANGQRPDP